VASPVKFSATPVRHEAPPPLLGEHTDSVLGAMLGLTGAELDALRGRKVI
jgi:crotonobetainyl-CoA:carnitine CoA-transferase CaiB-like acyl-CoA transferase